MTLRISPARLVATSTDPLVGKHASWNRIRLDEVANILNGFAFKSSLFNKDGIGVPLIRIRDVGAPSSVTWYDGEYEERYLVGPGDLLIGMDGDFRVARWQGPPALLNQRVCKITVRQDDVYDEKFLLYVLPGYLDAIHGATSSLTVKHLSSRSVGEIPLPLPGLAEQRRIVEAIEKQFSRLDAAEESLTHAESGIRRLRESCMTIPYDAQWPWTTLGEIADVVGGVTKDRKKEQAPGLIEVPYIRVANVQRGFLDLSELTTIRVHPARAKMLALQPGDVLLNEGGDRDKLGRGWVWSGEVPDCIHQNHVFRARLAANFAPKFVSWHANTYGRAWFQSRGSQTTNLASISRTNLRALPVPAPPLDVQESIAREIDERLSIVAAVQAETREAGRRANAVRRACLHEAFAGRLASQGSESDVERKVGA